MSASAARVLADCTCPLIESARGHAATVVAIQCGEGDACRLRALGLYEGAQVSVIDKRHCLLVDVRGTRLALGNDLASGITVRTSGSLAAS
jgi:Fe2+ transport system protein FeoA